MKPQSWLALAGFLLALVAPAEGSAHQPFTLDDNLIRVRAMIDGKSVTAVLDSGTSQVILNRAAAARLGLDPGAASISALGGGAGAQALRPLLIDSVQFGHLHLEDVHGFAMELTPLSMSAGFTIDALLGGPLFNTKIISVDYPNRRIDVLDSDGSVTCQDPIPIMIIAGVPVVAVTIRANGATPPTVLHLIIDLGTRHFAAMLGGSFLDTDAGRELLREARPTQIGTGTGGRINGSVANVRELKIEGQTFPNVQVALTREVKAFEMGAVDGTLGVPLWSSGGITFDYPHQRVCIVPGLGP